jgi:hypothetical protein
MSRRRIVVKACDLLPGDRIHTNRNQWRVLDPPVRLVMTHDVTVRFGIRHDDKGVTLRVNAGERFSVAREVPEPRTAA